MRDRCEAGRVEWLARAWIALMCVHLAVGLGYWSWRFIRDASGWSRSFDDGRVEICPNYRGIMYAGRELPASAVVLLEDSTPEDEHFCIYYLYPRRILVRPSADVTHVLQLGPDTARIRAVKASGIGP